MKGLYRFYQNGLQVGEASNLITTAGRPEVLRFFAGINSALAKGISVGLGDTAATTADTALSFEVSRAGVIVATPDYTAYTLTLKATINDPWAGTIYEVGAWNNYDQASQTTDVLFGFDQSLDAWSTGAWVTSGQRWGADALTLAPAASATVTTALTGLTMDLTKYADTQNFQFALNNANANLSTLRIRFMTDASNYYQYSLTGIGTGYRVITFSKGSAAATGAPAWNNITQVQIDAVAGSGGAASVILDALRTDVRDSTTNNVLISHAVLGTPVTKIAGVPLDIEYTVGLTV